MQIYYRGQISNAELSQIIHLHYQQFRWLKWVFGTILLMVLIFAGIALTQQQITLSYVFPGLLFPLVFLSYPWWVPYLLISSMKKPGNIYYGTIQGVIDDIGITLNGETMRANFQWKAYTHYKLAPGVALLYQGKNSFNVFTRSLFASDQDWNNFVNALSDKTRPQKTSV